MSVWFPRGSISFGPFDYQLECSRRVISGRRLREPRRGSAVWIARALVEAGLPVFDDIADEAAAELLGRGRDN